MKEAIAAAIASSFAAKPLTKLLYPFARVYSSISYRLQQSNGTKPPETSPPTHNFTVLRDKLCADLIVTGGPFKGMKYSSATAAGSTLYPKLLGTYEREIAPFIDNILERNFDLIVDIGCAEGYYAVGFALRFKNHIEDVIAFDTDPEAQTLCSQNASLNNVSITVKGFCNSATLIDTCLSKQSLVFVDAEGYENELINEEVAQKLRHCTFLIESHDFINIETTNYLLKCLANTHDVKTISSIDDIEKAYSYLELEEFNLSLHEKHCFFQEGRPTIMKWIYATPSAKTK